MTPSRRKDINVNEEEIRTFILNAVRSLVGTEYIDLPTTLDEAVEIVRELVNDTLDDI